MNTRQKVTTGNRTMERGDDLQLIKNRSSKPMSFVIKDENQRNVYLFMVLHWNSIFIVELE